MTHKSSLPSVSWNSYYSWSSALGDEPVIALEAMRDLLALNQELQQFARPTFQRMDLEAMSRVWGGRTSMGESSGSGATSTATGSTSAAAQSSGPRSGFMSGFSTIMSAQMPMQPAARNGVEWLRKLGNANEIRLEGLSQQFVAMAYPREKMNYWSAVVARGSAVGIQLELKGSPYQLEMGDSLKVLGAEIKLRDRKSSELGIVTSRYEITDIESGKSRTFTHLSLEWPDFGLPEAAAFIELLNSHKEAMREQPVQESIVHCRGGMGRTGTFIYALVMGELKDSDPKKVLTKMREQRHLVETTEQEQFAIDVGRVLAGRMNLDDFLEAQRVQKAQKAQSTRAPISRSTWGPRLMPPPIPSFVPTSVSTSVSTAAQEQFAIDVDRVLAGCANLDDFLAAQKAKSTSAPMSRSTWGPLLMSDPIPSFVPTSVSTSVPTFVPTFVPTSVPSLVPTLLPISPPLLSKPEERTADESSSAERSEVLPADSRLIAVSSTATAAATAADDESSSTDKSQAPGVSSVDDEASAVDEDGNEFESDDKATAVVIDTKKKRGLCVLL